MGDGGRLGAVFTSLVLVLAVALPTMAADSDNDGLWDGFEKKHGLTDPNVRDSDHDGVIDSAEDNDGDRLSNLGEQRFKTDPGKRDTDGDGIPDGKEDRNRDGVSNARAQDKRKVPANLKPSLSKAWKNITPIRGECNTPHGKARPVVCKFGPIGADVRVVLLGDSHAMMWASPIQNVSHNKNWRFITMTKTACPGLLGLHTKTQFEIDRGKSCNQ